MNRTNVSLFGLGIIGGTWARHLEDDGRLAACWNRTPKTAFPKWTDRPGDTALAGEILVIVLSDPPAVQGLLAKILPHLGPGHLVIQSTTIDPASSGRFQKQVTDTGARYLEAPFTGSKPAAEARKVVYYLGGEPDVIDAAEPVLSGLSDARIRIGSCEQAASLKLAMNLQIALQAGALCESLFLARSAGIPDETYFAALRKNAAWSGLTALKEPKVRDNDFSPQFSVKHMLKDMRLLRLAGSAKALPLAAEIERALRKAAEAGHADDDFIAVMKLLGLGKEEK